MNTNFTSAVMLQGMTIEELQNCFSSINSKFVQLAELISSHRKSELLTREEVANFFKCDISTIHNWTKQGKLKSYGIKGRVYYKSDEIALALIPLNSKE